MGRLKTLWSIGVILGLSAPAVAADFSPPPPPPAGPIASELGSGWYLRGDAGWVDFSDPGKAPLGAGLPFDRVGLRETWSVGGGIGYQINNWFRTDVTADWRNDAKFFGVNSGSNYVNGYSIDNGKIESSTLLLNGYIDFGRWYGFTPYVGAGVGVAQNHFHSYAGQVTCLTLACGPIGPQLPTPIPSHTTYNLAWAVMAGVAFDLGYGFKLDAGYRFVHVGDARTGVDAFGVGSKAKALDAQEVRLGVRYVID